MQMKQWKLRLLTGLMSLLTLVTSGCASNRGENVSYAIWNHDTSATLQKTSLDDGKGGSYSGAGVAHPRPINSIGWQDRGASYAAFLGARVPDYVFVSWRKMPKDGQKIYEGDLVGPFRITLRSRIPADVLEKVTGNNRYWVEIGVSAGVEPILVRWNLVDYKPSSGRPGIEILQRGGD